MRFLSVQMLSWLSLVAVVDSQCTICSTCTNQASRAQYEIMLMCLYLGPTIDDFICVLIVNVSELLPMMNNSLPTTVYCGGWQSTQDGDVIRKVISALVALQDRNVILLVWSNVAGGEYIFVARSVPGVGVYLANAIAVLRAGGLNTNGLKLVGHSLGAHVCGWAGKCGNWRLPMIIGLDPAGPLFTPENGLNSTDATFVLIIHTDPGRFGTIFQIGHVDFYPNGGIVQPACTLFESLFCPHNMSVFYYAASLSNGNLFIARLCNSYFEFQTGLCSSNPTVIMGEQTPTNTRGRYYLVTTAQPPYGLAQNGAG